MKNIINGLYGLIQTNPHVEWIRLDQMKTMCISIIDCKIHKPYRSNQIID